MSCLKWLFFTMCTSHFILVTYSLVAYKVTDSVTAPNSCWYSSIIHNAQFDILSTLCHSSQVNLENSGHEIPQHPPPPRTTNFFSFFTPNMDKTYPSFHKDKFPKTTWFFHSSQTLCSPHLHRHPDLAAPSQRHLEL